MIPDHPDPLKRLYATPIETLALAEDTLRFLKWNGITSLGHCASFYYQHVHETGWGYSPHLIMLMHGEVAAAVKAHGHWPTVLDADVWASLACSPSDIGTHKLVLWQGEERDLNTMPIEELGLSAEDIKAAKKAGLLVNINTVGDWLSNAVPSFTVNMSRVSQQWAEYEEGPDYPYAYLFEEIFPRFKALGYWSLLDASFNEDRPDNERRIFDHPARLYRDLFFTPIDELSFCHLESLKQGGITTVGLYLRFYLWAQRQGPDTLSETMRDWYDEGEYVLRKHDHWRFVDGTARERDWDVIVEDFSRPPQPF